MSQAFYTTVSVSSTSSAIPVKIGFVPGKVELINLTAVQTPTDGEGWKAVWQYGMSSGTAITTAYKSNGGDLLDLTTYASSNGVAILNPLGSEQGQYGAIVSGFTNANPGVITVDSTANAGITAGCFIQVSLLADDQSAATLNGLYYVASVTATTVTLGAAPAGVYQQQGTIKSANTSALAVYVSGGVVTVVQNANATTPNPPNNIYSDVPLWYNEAIQGISIGTSCFAGWDASDVILVAAYDFMQP